MTDDLSAELARRVMSREAIVRPAMGLARWASGIAAHSRPLVMVDFGIDLLQRRQIAAVAGAWSAEQAARLERRSYGSLDTRLDVSPYVPPQGQISAARQGAAQWEAASAPDFSPEARSHLSSSRDMDAIRRELEALGWKMT